MSINFFENNYYEKLIRIVFLLLILTILTYIFFKEKIELRRGEILIVSEKLNKSFNKSRLEDIDRMDLKLLELKEEKDKLKVIEDNNIIKNRKDKTLILKAINRCLLEDMKLENIVVHSDLYIIEGFSYSNDRVILYKKRLEDRLNMGVDIKKIEELDNYYDFQINIKGD